MNPGRRLFLTSNENVKSGFIVPIIGNTIYRGNTEIIATKNPFAKFDSSPRNKHSFWGLTTIERTIKTESAISRSRIEELSTVWLGISRSEVMRHTFCHARLTTKEATTAKIALEILEFNVAILSYLVYFRSQS
jgi:hypothetical protein